MYHSRKRRASQPTPAARPSVEPPSFPPLLRGNAPPAAPRQPLSRLQTCVTRSAQRRPSLVPIAPAWDAPPPLRGNLFVPPDVRQPLGTASSHPRSHRSRVGTLPRRSAATLSRASRRASAARPSVELPLFPPLPRGNAPPAAPRQPLSRLQTCVSRSAQRRAFLVPNAPAWPQQ